VKSACMSLKAVKLLAVETHCNGICILLSGISVWMKKGDFPVWNLPMQILTSHASLADPGLCGSWPLSRRVYVCVNVGSRQCSTTYKDAISSALPSATTCSRTSRASRPWQIICQKITSCFRWMLMSSEPILFYLCIHFLFCCVS